jgi:hypothetical protein
LPVILVDKLHAFFGRLVRRCTRHTVNR